MAKFGRILTIIGFVLHTTAILFRYIEAGHFPAVSLHESLSFFAWATILVYLICDYKTNIPSLGSFVLPLTSLSLIYSVILPTHIEPLNPALQSAWLWSHTLSAFLGYGAFAVAFCLAIVYLIQEHQLKRKKPGAFYYRLPSLETHNTVREECRQSTNIPPVRGRKTSQYRGERRTFIRLPGAARRFLPRPPPSRTVGRSGRSQPRRDPRELGDAPVSV